MSNLIKNELTKIFKKKGIYITLLVVLAFIILTNCIYKYFYNDDVSSYYYSEDYIEYAKQVQEQLERLGIRTETQTNQVIQQNI